MVMKKYGAPTASSWRPRPSVSKASTWRFHASAVSPAPSSELGAAPNQWQNTPQPLSANHSVLSITGTPFCRTARISRAARYHLDTLVDRYLVTLKPDDSPR